MRQRSVQKVLKNWPRVSDLIKPVLLIYDKIVVSAMIMSSESGSPEWSSY